MSISRGGSLETHPPRPDWNVPASGVGYVTRFQIDAEFVSRYPVQQAGGRDIVELWVPADELAEFNRHIVGLIEVAHEFRSAPGGDVLHA